MVVVVGALYYLLDGDQGALGAAAPWAVGAVVLALYAVSVQQAARSPDLPEDIDIDNPKPLDTWPTVRAGLHFLIPIGTLIWCLMVEEMSPGAVGVLGHRRAGGADAHAAPADRHAAPTSRWATAGCKARATSSAA